MDKQRPAWWDVRFPALFYVIGATFIVGAVLHVADGDSVLLAVLGFLVGALNWVAATVTIVQRRRAGLPAIDPAPLAQESDPNRP